MPGRYWADFAGQRGGAGWGWNWWDFARMYHEWARKDGHAPRTLMGGPVERVMGANISVVWLVMAGAVALFGALVAAWALGSDRSRGRKRCPKCWYDMSAASGLICPECGHDAERPLRLEKTRRRWGVAAIGLAIALVSLYPAVRATQTRNGLWSLVPTEGLIQWLNVTGWSRYRKPGASEELFWRFIIKDVSESQRVRVYDAALPASISTRSRWPSTLPLRVIVQPAVFYSGRDVRQFVVKWQPSQGAPITHSVLPVDTMMCVITNRYRDTTEELAMVPAGAAPVHISAELTGDFGKWTGLHQLNVQVVPTLNDAITPVKDARVDQVVRSSMGLLIYQPSYARSYLQMNWGNCQLIAPPGLSDLAFGIRVEFRHGDELVATSRFCFIDTFAGNPAVSEVPLDGNVSRLFDADINDPLWTVAVIGDGEMALRRFDREKYWAGTITMPLSGVMRYVQGAQGWHSWPEE